MEENNKMEDASMDDSSMAKKTTASAPMANTDSGLDQNVAAALCYIFIIGLVFIFTEKKNKFVRFHAFQSVFLGVGWFLGSFILGIIPVLGWIISPFFAIAMIVLWVYTIYQAYLGKEFRLPVIGDMAAEQAAKDVPA